MRVLTFTTLYPNGVHPRHGIFVETRLRELVKSGEVSVRVVAPCPWFPFAAPAFGHYSSFAAIPRSETRYGISIQHPRYAVIPKIGMSMAPALLYCGVRRTIRRIIADCGGFDLIDAHYFYPDGVAAVMLGREFRRPVTITARGSDLNLIARQALPRRMIRWAADKSQGLVTVSAALRDRLAELGVARERICVLRNGVDLALFQPRNRQACRAGLGLAGLILLSVGNLVPIKGHELTIEALVHLRDAHLLLVGDGPERGRLEALARQRGVADRVSFFGNVPQSELPNFYAAADFLILASRHEGWPNVLLEAMACGTPVVASAIPGIDEIIQSPAVGRLLPGRDPAALAAAVRRFVADGPDRAAIRRYAEGFGWDATTAGQLALFRSVLRSGQHAAGPVT